MLNRNRYERIVQRMTAKALRTYTSNFYAQAKELSTVEALTTLSQQELSDAAIKQLYINIYKLVGVAYANDTYKTLSNPQKSLNWYWEQMMIVFASTVCGDRIASVTRQTWLGIQLNTQKAIEFGTKQGWGVGQIATEITKLQGKMEKWRALRIARTEVVGASNKGSFDGATSTGLKVQKVWLTQEDDSVRTTPKDGATPHKAYDHKAMNGVKVGLNEPFIMRSVAGDEEDAIMFPGDPTGKAGNVINCRCTIIYETEI